MRRIRGSLFVSLDGVMQAPGGPTEDPTGDFQHGGWLPQFFDADIGDAIDDFFRGDYDLLLGRRTYEIFAAYWPYVGGEATGMGEIFDLAGKDEGEAAAIAMGEAFTRANKYVLTRGSPDLGWSNSHRLGSIEELSAIRDGDGPDLLIQGSSTIYPALIAAGLDGWLLYEFRGCNPIASGLLGFEGLASRRAFAWIPAHGVPIG